jgi:hypothetical protein
MLGLVKRNRILYNVRYSLVLSLKQTRPFLLIVRDLVSRVIQQRITVE